MHCLERRKPLHRHLTMSHDDEVDKPLHRHLTMSHDDEVDVAVLVGIADSKRALEVRAAEVLAENRRRTRDQIVQNIVELWKGSRSGHHNSISAVFEPDALAAALAPLIAVGQEERPFAPRQPVADDAADDTFHPAALVRAAGPATLTVLTRRS